MDADSYLSLALNCSPQANTKKPNIRELVLVGLGAIISGVIVGGVCMFLKSDKSSAVADGAYNFVRNNPVACSLIAAVAIAVVTLPKIKSGFTAKVVKTNKKLSRSRA